MAGDVDPSLMQDFLTEAGELIEQLDADLVRLEQEKDTAKQQEMLNSVFRALHTVKGAASFLGLEEVIRFAHAAEDALNRLRKGEVAVTQRVMDSLLRSVDVLRGQIDSLNNNEPVEQCPDDLLKALRAITTGESQSADDGGQSTTADSQPQVQGAQSTEPEPIQSNARPLKLPAQKQDLVEFMVADLNDAGAQIDQCLEQARSAGTRTDAAEHMVELADSMGKTADFFELPDLTQLIAAFGGAAAKLADTPDVLLDDMLVRMAAVRELARQQAEALDKGLVLSWPTQTLIDRLNSLAQGQKLDDAVAGKHSQCVEGVLALDGVVAAQPTAPSNNQPQVKQDTSDAAGASGSTDPGDAGDGNDNNAKNPGASSAKAGTTVAEQTIRVEVGRLESLLNLVGQLVLTKNRFLGMTRKMRDLHLPHETLEDMAQAAGELDRLTGNLQVGVMRTRMQPLAKLFDRYPRVIRDMARMTEKKLNLELVGKDTEVDKSVLELLADPLVHILRNSADHGVESPQKRIAAGKSETGTIRLSAEHQGSHVRVEVYDDGKGLDRDVLGRKAIEKGLTTQDELATLSDDEVFRFIFAAGFSTAEKVSDLSGRGVGMDVVRTNIAKLNGVVNVSSVKGEGTTIEILIPLTVAIMPAMVVGVGMHLYAVPLQSIIEIVRPEAASVHSVSGQPVMRLRDAVLPLLDMRSRLGEIGPENGNRFAVVVGVGQQRVGLLVDKLIGQQEVVIKPLDDEYTTGGPFSGATIREDGDVSLILDVVQLIRTAGTGQEKAAA